MDLEQTEKTILKDPVLLKLSNLARDKDIPLFLVGGYIRDFLLGTHCKDYDFTLPREAAPAIAAIEEALQCRFFKVGKEELDRGAYRIIKEEISLDISLFQGHDIAEDLKRRDFTINAIAFSLKNRTFHWVEGALDDIEKKILRAVSSRSIDQDPLRMLRAIRYHCTLAGFAASEELMAEISSQKDLITRIPGERIKMELDRILLSPRSAEGIRLLFQATLLLTLFPELKGLRNLGQNDHHHVDALSHTLLTMEKISSALEWISSKGKEIHLGADDLLALHYGALFHDIGKQDTYTEDDSHRVHFYHHEFFSCRAAEAIMERLRFPNALRNRILRIVGHHMRVHNLPEMTKDSALKRLVHRLGDETALLVLHTFADKEASRGLLSIQRDEVVEAHCLRILEMSHQEEIVHPPHLINGHDVMALGYSPGPRVGQILNFIRRKQITGEIKTREEAMGLLKEKFALNG